MDRDEMIRDCCCPVCDERFVDWADLLDHLRNHVDDGIAIADEYIDECFELAIQQEAQKDRGDEEE